jgi:hypothetical protein
LQENPVKTDQNHFEIKVPDAVKTSALVALFNQFVLNEEKIYAGTITSIL